VYGAVSPAEVLKAYDEAALHLLCLLLWFLLCFRHKYHV
jgi:hypothetical protein